jgi:ribosomal protein S14
MMLKENRQPNYLQSSGVTELNGNLTKVVMCGITLTKESIMQVTKGSDGRYYKDCPSCGQPQSYLRKNYAEESLKLSKECKKCANKLNPQSHKGWHRGIRVSWFNQFKSGAELRGLNWDLTLDDVADLLQEQDYKCALTGWSIEFPESGHPQAAPASLDRIDSKKAYTKENTQLLTRQVNMMKQQYSQEDFIKVCHAVAANHKVK